MDIELFPVWVTAKTTAMHRDMPFAHYLLVHICLHFGQESMSRVALVHSHGAHVCAASADTGRFLLTKSFRVEMHLKSHLIQMPYFMLPHSTTFSDATAPVCPSFLYHSPTNSIRNTAWNHRAWKSSIESCPGVKQSNCVIGGGPEKHQTREKWEFIILSPKLARKLWM